MTTTATEKSTVNLLELSADGVREILASFDHILSDCDGVLWLHNTAIAGSAGVLNRLQSAGKRVHLVTNNSSRTRAEFADKARCLGFQIRTEQIVSTARVAAQYLAKHLRPDQSVYVIGSAGIARELDELGVKHIGSGPDKASGDADPVQYLTGGAFQTDDSVAAVLVGWDAHFSFVKLSKAATYLRRSADCLFVATSIDQRSPIREAAIPGTGALLRAVEEASGRRAQQVLGKPDPLILAEWMAEHRRLLQTDGGRGRVLLIGDRCNTDVALGARCGFQTLLVGTGVHRPEDAQNAEQRPDWFVPALGDLEPFL